MRRGYFYVALATRAAVDACEPDAGGDAAAPERVCRRHVGVFVFSAEPGADGATVYSRMFAPEAGVVEDPATGSASGPLAAYLVRHGVVPMAARRHRERAGREDGPARAVCMRASRRRRPTDITRVHVGGAAVSVGEGTMRGKCLGTCSGVCGDCPRDIYDVDLRWIVPETFKRLLNRARNLANSVT